MKKIFMLLAIMMIAGGVKAKNEVTTLWEGSSVGGAEISLAASKFSSVVSGDIIRISFSFTSAGSLHLCYKIGEVDGWKARAFNGIDEYPYYYDTDVTSAEFSINETDVTTLKNYGMYVYGFESSTITKIELIHSMTPQSTTNISSVEYAADWDGQQYGAVESAKIGDVIQFTYTATGTYSQIYVMNYAKGEEFKYNAYSVVEGDSYTYEYIIPDYETLKKIRTEGFSIKGADFKVTSVDLLTYSDCYGYTTVTIGDTGYATWSSDKKYDFATAGITAYYASAVSKGTVTLTSIDITWDWKGYILKGEPGDYDVMESLTGEYHEVDYLKCNISSSTIAASTAETYHYIFAIKEGSTTPCFYKLTSDYELAAHKAYLETTEDITPASDVKAVSLFFNDEATGITTVETMPREDEAVYTMSGVRVAKPTRGLYIIGGRKVIVK